jgi:hypothetical protein
LRAEECEGFNDPELLRLPDPAVPPKASVRGSLETWIQVVERVLAADGLEFADEDEVPRDPHGGFVKSGYFAIRKDASSDRTITNAIPANSLESSVGLAHALLAHCVSLGEIVLYPDEKLRGSGRDLPDAYHSARVSLRRAFRNAVGPWIDAARFRGSLAYERLMARRAERGRHGPPRKVTACWRSLPMGDLNAVDYMQIAHLNCLRSAGCCTDDSLITYKRPLPPGEDGVWEGIVVDDYNVIGRVPRSLTASEAAADTRRVAVADAQYAREGRKPKPAKCYMHEEIFHCWGGTVDGERGSVQAGAELQGRLLLLALRTLYAGRTTPGVWKAIVGLFSYCAFVGGRTGLAMFDWVYAEARDLEDGEVFAPSSRARAELEGLLVFLPFMYVDLRASCSERVFATDASSRSAAIVESRVGTKTAEQMWQFRYRKGTASASLRTLSDLLEPRLGASRAHAAARVLLGLDDMLHEGPPVGCLDEPAPEEAPAWTAAVADALGWQPLWHGPVEPSWHINRKEALPIGLLGRRLAADPGSHRRRFVVLVDSSVNVAAWSKGRSRSRRLNGTLQRACPELLLAGIRLGFVHVRSKFNPADDPTRGRPVRAVPAAVPFVGSSVARLLGVGPPLSFAELGALTGCDVALPGALLGVGEGPFAWSPWGEAPLPR